jgi:hypothetical protein
MAGDLHGAGLRHAGRNISRGVALHRQGQNGKGNRRHLDRQIETVHKRTADPAHVVISADRGMAASIGRIGHQHEEAGIAAVGIGMGDNDLANLDRLAQGFQHGVG